MAVVVLPVGADDFDDEGDCFTKLDGGGFLPEGFVGELGFVEEDDVGAVAGVGAIGFEEAAFGEGVGAVLAAGFEGEFFADEGSDEFVGAGGLHGLGDSVVEFVGASVCGVPG